MRTKILNIIIFLFALALSSILNAKDEFKITNEKYELLLKNSIDRINNIFDKNKELNNLEEKQFFVDLRDNINEPCSFYYNTINKNLNDCYNSPPGNIAYYILITNVEFTDYINKDYLEYIVSLKSPDEITIQKVKDIQIDIANKILNKYNSDIAKNSKLGTGNDYIILSTYNIRLPLQGEEDLGCKCDNWEVWPSDYFDNRLGMDFVNKFNNNCCNQIPMYCNDFEFTSNSALCGTLTEGINNAIKILIDTKKPKTTLENYDPYEIIKIINSMFIYEIEKIELNERIRLLNLLSKINISNYHGGPNAIIKLLDHLKDNEINELFVKLKSDNIFSRLDNLLSYEDNDLFLITLTNKFYKSNLYNPNTSDNVTYKNTYVFNGFNMFDGKNYLMLSKGNVYSITQSISDSIYILDNYEIDVFSTIEIISKVPLPYIDATKINNNCYLISAPIFYLKMVYNIASRQSNKQLGFTAITIAANAITIGSGYALIDSEILLYRTIGYIEIVSGIYGNVSLALKPTIELKYGKNSSIYEFAETTETIVNYVNYGTSAIQLIRLPQLIAKGRKIWNIERSKVISDGVLPESEIKKLDDLYKYTDELVNGAGSWIDDVFDLQKYVFNQNKNIIAKLSSNHKGAWGEIATDVYLTKKGFQPLHTRKTALTDGWGETGIDGVFKKDGQYYIIEAKYTGYSTLNTTIDGKQLSKGWIEGSNRLRNAVGETIADEIKLLGYKKIWAKVAPDGTITFKEATDDFANTFIDIIP